MGKYSVGSKFTSVDGVEVVITAVEEGTVYRTVTAIDDPSMAKRVSRTNLFTGTFRMTEKDELFGIGKEFTSLDGYKVEIIGKCDIDAKYREVKTECGIIKMIRTSHLSVGNFLIIPRKSSKVGSIRETKHYGLITVLEVEGPNHRTVRFHDTGVIKKGVTTGLISRGYVVDETRREEVNHQLSIARLAQMEKARESNPRVVKVKSKKKRVRKVKEKVSKKYDTDTENAIQNFWDSFE